MVIFWHTGVHQDINIVVVFAPPGVAQGRPGVPRSPPCPAPPFPGVWADPHFLHGFPGFTKMFVKPRPFLEMLENALKMHRYLFSSGGLT